MFSASQIAQFFNQPYPEQINEKAWFFACWYKFTYIESWSNNFWLGMGRNGRGQSGHGTLRLTVSQKWIDGMNWYFACWCKFTLQSCFSDFWVGVVRNRSDHLVHETLTSALSKEWVYEWSWFSACWLWGNNFWLGRHCTLYLWLLNATPLQLN